MNAAVEFIYECHECGTSGTHRYDGEEVACLACGTPRDMEPELIASVLDMRFCEWCRATLPASHTCRTDEPPCESPAHLHPSRCGACATDLYLQERDLAARAARERAEFEHGSPIDLDGSA